ncbi:MAG TPA: hypothetical protein VFQ86_07040 [Arachidicoccus soli]|uniref:Uncharacterized protein n=1 Tax=Arachidicoccus soli TaxID=2341117 RepID=A0A386HPP2_9BACT|nr:hypothetical protein [Arachidicoccus soli]AYD47546.1 hypothetical protein D6B99_07985 [Arachidicoccus soli]HEU0227475.1 hypothetical protein [Arachidicoccus soli]
MEVHHHPDLHHKKKNFKEYFLEFIMIFLAVIMGFIAENIREDISQHQRAKSFAASMIDDLKADTSQIISYNKYYTIASDNIDSFMNLVTANDLKNIPTGKLYWYGLWGGARHIFIPDDATFQQMKSSGSLSFYKPEIATNVEKYDRLCRSLLAIDDMNRDVYTDVRKTRAQIFEFKYNEMANDIAQKNGFSPNQARIDSFINTNPPLLSYDKTLFNEYAELVRSRFIRIYNVAYSDSLLKQANIVLRELQNEYK